MKAEDLNHVKDVVSDVEYLRNAISTRDLKEGQIPDFRPNTGTVDSIMKKMNDTEYQVFIHALLAAANMTIARKVAELHSLGVTDV